MIILAAPTHYRANKWFKDHMQVHDRVPATITSLDFLKGIRDAIIILLPGFVIDPQCGYKLERNTIIDLRNTND